MILLIEVMGKDILMVKNGQEEMLILGLDNILNQTGLILTSLTGKSMEVALEIDIQTGLDIIILL